MSTLGFSIASPLARLTPDERRRLCDRSIGPDARVAGVVADIIARVRAGGDAAVRELARRFESAEPRALEVPRSAWQAARATLGSAACAALERAARNVAAAHERWRPQPSDFVVEPGVRLVRRPVALERAGVYAPGGRAAYASSVLMGVVPARVAGVREIIVCSPPGIDGLPALPVLAAADIAGATRCFAIGGAAAVAAMAFGTESLPAVDCIVGPGNQYVTEAKLQLARFVRTDGPAGPSEVLIVADDTADPRRVAFEMAAQAEHGNDSAAVAILVGGAEQRARLERELADVIADWPRRDVVRRALETQGALLQASTVGEALEFADEYAPEHLVIMARNAEALAERVRAAGAVFVGPAASVVFGDYVTGANHILPTAGAARTQSGLAMETFMRWTVTQIIEPIAARSLAGVTATLATLEGLPGHAAAATHAAQAGA